MDTLQIRPAYKLQDFCSDFAVSKTTAYEEMKTGRLRFYMVGNDRRIAGQDALAWQDALRAAVRREEMKSQCPEMQTARRQTGPGTNRAAALDQRGGVT